MGSALGRIVLSAAVVLGGLAALTATWYLLALAVAALVRRPPGLWGPPRTRLAVLVPAHDEERLVGRCGGPLGEEDYPTAVPRLIGVADNCTDATPQVAPR